MCIKKILSWFLLLFGEAIIITAFILFRGKSPDDILILNIVVSSLIYILFFFSYAAPWINLQDKSQKQVGAMGIGWFVTCFYALFAIATMIAANRLELVFTVQLLIHCVLLFFLLLGIWFSRHAADKVKEVYQTETQHRNGINDMKTAMRQLKDKMNETDGLPELIMHRINLLEENLRFISPLENGETCNLENEFVESVNEIQFAVSDYSMNKERIESNLKKLERIYQNRKNIYSK